MSVYEETKETLIAKYARPIAQGKVNVEDALADFADEIIGLTIRALLHEEAE